MKRTILGALLITVGFSLFAGAQKKAPTALLTTEAIPFNNPGVVVYPNPEKFSRVVAISDVHGMWQNLFNLLLSTHLIAYDVSTQRIMWTGANTLLVVIGDSIDKGPDSLYVIDFWMNIIPQARAAGGDVIHALGNHEAEFLADPTNPKAAVFIEELKRKNVPLKEVINPSYPRGAFLRSMPLAVRVGRYLFVHAGLYPQMDWETFSTKARTILSAGGYDNGFVTGNNSTLEAKDWWRDGSTRSALEANLAANGMYGVVFGHMPEALNVKNDVGQGDMMKLVKTDSGMSPEAGGHPGHMVVFLKPTELNQMAPPQAVSMTLQGFTHPL